MGSWGGRIQNGSMRYIHHLIEQVLKFKKNPTLAQKSEKLRGLSIFYFFFSLFSPTPLLIFHFWKKKRNRSIFIRFRNGCHQVVRKNIRNTPICPKKKLDSPG